MVFYSCVDLHDIRHIFVYVNNIYIYYIICYIILCVFVCVCVCVCVSIYIYIYNIPTLRS
jgi:hypothetical protein